MLHKLTILSFILGTITAAAQPSQQCGELLSRAFEDFRTPTSEGYAMSYSMETTLVSGEVNTENVQLKMFGKRSFIQTDNSRVYQDDVSLVAIDDVRKTVFITKAINKAMIEQQLSQMTLLQDSLLNNCPHILCESEESDTGTFKKISLNDQNDIVRSLGLESMTYWLDSEKEQIKKINASYLSGNEMMKAVTISFGEVDKNYQKEAYSGTAVSQVYTESGQLRKVFAHYKIINNLK